MRIRPSNDFVCDLRSVPPFAWQQFPLLVVAGHSCFYVAQMSSDVFQYAVVNDCSEEAQLGNGGLQFQTVFVKGNAVIPPEAVKVDFAIGLQRQVVETPQINALVGPWRRAQQNVVLTGVLRDEVLQQSQRQRWRINKIVHNHVLLRIVIVRVQRS